MEGFFVLLGIALLALPVIAIVALVMAVGNRDRLRALDLRFGALERQLAAVGAAATPAATYRTGADDPLHRRAEPVQQFEPEPTPPAAETIPPMEPARPSDLTNRPPRRQHRLRCPNRRRRP